MHDDEFFVDVALERRAHAGVRLAQDEGALVEPAACALKLGNAPPCANQERKIGHRDDGVYCPPPACSPRSRRSSGYHARARNEKSAAYAPPHSWGGAGGGTVCPKVQNRCSGRSRSSLARHRETSGRTMSAESSPSLCPSPVHRPAYPGSGFPASSALRCLPSGRRRSRL